MDKKEILSKLTEIFQKTFKNEKISITEKTAPSDLEDWDSLNHASLIYTIEQDFNIKFNLNEILNFSDVGRICEAIQNKLQN